MWNAILLSALGGADLATARVELLAGRSDIADERGVQSLVGGGQALDLEGPAYLELGPASRLAVRWRQEASLDLRGSAALEWRSPHDGRGVLITAWRVTELDFEVRRGPLRLDLSGGWRVELEFGAASLRTLADGRLEVRHIAGAPLALFCTSAPGLVSPPWTVLPGAVVRLDAAAGRPIPTDGAPARIVTWPAASRSSNRIGDARAPAWSEFAWPWLDGVGARRGAQPAPTVEASPARLENARIAPACADMQPPTFDGLELPRRSVDATEGADSTGGLEGAAERVGLAVPDHRPGDGPEHRPNDGAVVTTGAQDSVSAQKTQSAAIQDDSQPKPPALLWIAPTSTDWFEFSGASVLWGDDAPSTGQAPWPGDRP